MTSIPTKTEIEALKERMIISTQPLDLRDWYVVDYALGVALAATGGAAVTPEIMARLEAERLEREARKGQWREVEDALGWLPNDGQIYVERNELQLDDYLSSQGKHSYLEQVRLHEVGPGEGQPIVDALLLLPKLLDHLTRDMMSDDERIAVGWNDLQTAPPAPESARLAGSAS